MRSGLVRGLLASAMAATVVVDSCRGAERAAGPGTARPAAIVVSDTTAAPPAAVAASSARRGSRDEVLGQSSIVYVSLPAGTAPDGAVATVRNPRTGEIVATSIV